jgi:hypothetical protein
VLAASLEQDIDMPPHPNNQQAHRPRLGASDVRGDESPHFAEGVGLRRLPRGCVFWGGGYVYGYVFLWEGGVWVCDMWGWVGFYFISLNIWVKGRCRLRSLLTDLTTSPLHFILFKSTSRGAGQRYEGHFREDEPPPG